MHTAAAVPAAIYLHCLRVAVLLFALCPDMTQFSPIAADKQKEDKIRNLLSSMRSEYSAVAEHPISWNRATGSIIKSQSSDGGSHDLCRGSQLDDLVFDHPFPLPHGNIPVNPHGIGRWDDTVKDGISKGTAS